MPDPERIYLEPGAGDPMSGRQWCEDNVWDGDEAYEGLESTEYVRADRFAELEAENARLEAAKKELKEISKRYNQENARLWAENARIEDDSVHAYAGFTPEPLRRRAEEMVEELNDKLRRTKPSAYGDHYTVPTKNDELVEVVVLLRELAGLEDHTNACGSCREQEMKDDLLKWMEDEPEEVERERQRSMRAAMGEKEEKHGN